MNRSLFTLAALAAVLFLTPPHAGAGPDTEAPPEAPRKSSTPAGIPFRGQVGSVDPAAMTVTLAGKKRDRVLHITGQTRIERDGRTAVIGDIRPGDQARGSLAKDAEGREVLLKATFIEGAGSTASAGL